MKRSIWQLVVLGVLGFSVIFIIASAALSAPVSENIKQSPVDYLVCFGLFCFVMGVMFTMIHCWSVWGTRGEIATIKDMPEGKVFCVVGEGSEIQGGTLFILHPLEGYEKEEYAVVLGDRTIRDELIERGFLIKKKEVSGMSCSFVVEKVGVKA